LFCCERASVSSQAITAQVCCIVGKHAAVCSLLVHSPIVVRALAEWGRRELQPLCNDARHGRVPHHEALLQVWAAMPACSSGATCQTRDSEHFASPHQVCTVPLLCPPSTSLLPMKSAACHRAKDLGCQELRNCSTIQSELQNLTAMNVCSCSIQSRFPSSNSPCLLTTLCF
jgi:hypothetical protein